MTPDLTARLAFVCLLALCCRRAPAAQEGDQRVLAEAAGIRFTEREYKDYLYTLFARTRLEELVMDRLLAIEAKELGIAADEAEIARRSKEELRRVVAEEFGGSEEAMRKTYEGQGFTPAEREAVDLLQRRRAWLKEAIVRKTRVPTEERIAATFDRLHGVDGIQVQVRHIFVSAGVVRAELLKQGKRIEDITEEVLEAEGRRRIDDVRALLARGDAFDDLVRRFSNDEPSRTRGGVIEGYNYQQYGVPFAEAVRAAPVGSARGPVRSTSGWHMIKVDSRKVTKFADVRASVVETVLAEPPSLAELHGLEGRLRGKYPITRPK
jgi:parvulin-like peptidyl-prolyl isomerase